MIPFCGIARRFSIKRSLGETCSLVGSSPFFDGEQAINAPRHNMIINFVFFMITVFLYERKCKRYRADNLVLFYRIVVLFLFLSLYLYTFFRGYLLFKYPCVDLDRLAREIRDIIGINRAIVIGFRIFLGKEKGLAYLAILIHACQIKAGIKAVTPAATEDKPAGVATPVVKAFGIIAIYFG